ncbi:MAG: glucose 1-dehydrogenase [Candidatus Rokubacteria bacterium]|nr:glucose 1-dehydrogenase [Candidatus Rokubacteria bacterium]
MLHPGYSLEGKTAIVVGGGSGIGRASSLVFAEAGANVVCADIDEPGALATASKAGARATAFRLDVTDLGSCRAAVATARDRFGGLDVLLFGAATRERAAKVPDFEEAEWNEVLRVNLTGAFLMCKAAIPAMVARGGGSIILIASQLGRVASPERAAYCATKGAIVQLAKAMALDHAADRIRVNALSPGPIGTERLAARFGDLDGARRALGDKQLVKRLGEPEEIARAALFLASDASSFMTGADLLVDGGYTAV